MSNTPAAATNIWGASSTSTLYQQPMNGAGLADSEKFVNRDGFDLIWRQRKLGDQMAKIEDDIRKIEENANLSDTEKMFAMQMAMNTWSAISNLRTNMLKSVSDTLKTIARNVA